MRVVTIDGPAGAGKSTVARRLASRLGWRLLDTGAMYRAVTLAALRGCVDLGDDAALSTLADTLVLELPPGVVVLDGEDVTLAVRSPEVTRAVRFVADRPGVRARLVRHQRAFALGNQVVTEGRDQGTVVFPDALCKFFLTASPEERARRRHAELSLGREAPSYESILRDQLDRDARDAARSIAPMRAADDAEHVDTTGLGFDAVVALLEGTVRARLSEAADPTGSYTGGRGRT